MSVDWYRVDLPGAPQGHGLATDWNESMFVAWEDLGAWYVKRVDKNGSETKTVRADTFPEVREGVEYAKRTMNPDLQVPAGFSIARVGVGALIGSVIGMGLGGLPGIIKKNSALATVGTQIGGVIGAATGAVVADRLKSDNRDPSIDELKSKLLK